VFRSHIVVIVSLALIEHHRGMLWNWFTNGKKSSTLSRRLGAVVRPTWVGFGVDLVADPAEMVSPALRDRQLQQAPQWLPFGSASPFHDCTHFRPL
jgi:hypothetical protein